MDSLSAAPPGDNPRGHATPTPPHPLDRLVAATTALGTWAELVARLERGYVPTIRPESRRKRLLAKAIVAAGYRVWPAPAGKAVAHA